MRKLTGTLMIAFALAATTPVARADGDDEALYWNNVVLRSIQTAATPGALQARQAAIVHVAMFDAFNGIERRYTQIHVTDLSPRRGASRRAAIVQAAYASLVWLFPSQINALTGDREASLAGIAADDAIEDSESIARGLEWGQRVAGDHRLAQRGRFEYGAVDVFRQPHTRQVAPDAAPAVDARRAGTARTSRRVPDIGDNHALRHPVAIVLPVADRAAGLTLTSAQYAAEFNEVKLVGEAVTLARTADQTVAARFWAGTAAGFWNRAAAAASRERHLTLSDNARLFALLNVAIADAVISCWDAEYFFEFWRPITAIREANTDGNPATDPAADLDAGC